VRRMIPMQCGHADEWFMICLLSDRSGFAGFRGREPRCLCTGVTPAILSHAVQQK
jgi:hypothetical protein